MTVPAGAPPTVGEYTLLAGLGEGGMGVVHLARRAGSRERVALKVLRPHVVGDSEARARLEREVASLRRIRSPWVAEIIDADPWGPVPFVATRYVPGLSLHDHVVEEGPIPEADLAWFAAALAEGIGSVHAAGVLHRDVKPSNVLLEGRAPILIDFGLARVADDPRLTHTGFLLGTPGYLAPEILFGEDATTASDVHSWAATVAYAATGRPPYGRGPSMAILDRVRRGEHDLSGIAEPVRGLLADALSVEPHLRPTLTEIRQRLSAATPDGSGDPGTAPYAVTHGEDDGRVAAGRTRVLTAEQTLAHPTAPAAAPAAGARRGAAVRRALLLLAAGAVVAAAAAAYPLWTLVLVSVLVWLLRSGSLAVTAVDFRRRRRGRRWYDGVQALAMTPWDLVRSIPGTLLLLVLAFGIGASAGLLGYAIRPDEALGLAVAGLGSAVGLWVGPGGSRVRGPVSRVADTLAARPRRWGVALVCLVALALALGVVVEQRGPDWGPAGGLGDGGPLSGPLPTHAGPGHGTMGP